MAGKELNRLGQKLDEVFLAEVHEQKLWVYPDVKKLAEITTAFLLQS